MTQAKIKTTKQRKRQQVKRQHQHTKPHEGKSQKQGDKKKMISKEFFDKLKKERTTYKDMIDFCCDSLILNNYIMQELQKKDIYFDLYCGSDYDEELDEFEEIYQYFLISERDAERLAEYTNEIVFYNEDLGLYILGVTHCGTGWDYVPSNWKE